jgi:hypothetical protein
VRFFNCNQQQKDKMKHRTIRPINQLVIPARTEQAIKDGEKKARIQQIQDDCIRILNSDVRFSQAYTALIAKLREGGVTDSTFRNTVKWQVSAALRRAGLPLRTAKLYLIPWQGN